jgi:cobalt-precorrin 5A hydrolase
MQAIGNNRDCYSKSCEKKDLAVYALTPQGAQLAKLIASKLGGELFLSKSLTQYSQAKAFNSLMQTVAEQFGSFRAHVFVAAAGIAVRAIAAHIQNKQKDPAVVVLDQQGEYAISLLSGHLGQANKLARCIAQITGGQAVITTATDNMGLPSLDVLAQEQGMFFDDIQALREVSAALLRGEKVQLYDPQGRLRLSLEQKKHFKEINEQAEWSAEKAGVWVDWQRAELGPKQLLLNPPCLSAGIGCNRGTSYAEILELVEETFEEHGLALKSLTGIASIEQKSDEQGLLEAAKELNLKLNFYSAWELKEIKTPSPSEVVHSYMGVHSVCEAAACRLAGSKHLVVGKVKTKNVTLAVALS